MKTYELSVTNEVDDFLHDFAKRNGVSIAEAVRRAFALLSILDEERRKEPGCSMAVVRELEDQSLEPVVQIEGI